MRWSPEDVAAAANWERQAIARDRQSVRDLHGLVVAGELDTSPGKLLYGIVRDIVGRVRDRAAYQYRAARLLLVAQAHRADEPVPFDQAPEADPLDATRPRTSQMLTMTVPAHAPTVPALAGAVG